MIALLGLLACDAPLDCSDPATVIAVSGEDTLTCHAAGWPVAYIEVLAARPVARGDEGLAHKAVADRFRADPSGTLAWLEQIRSSGHALAGAPTTVGAADRAHRVWMAFEGTDLIRADAKTLWEIQKRTLAVWSSSDASEIAMTEADIEGWIRYASLCREAQQGGVLRISVADRVSVYQMVRDRFEDGDASERLALASMGPLWNHVRDRWPNTSFDIQQTWISIAPLPGPMTATSLGYAQAVIDGPPAGHVASLEKTLGPFTVATSRSMLSAEVPSR